MTEFNWKKIGLLTHNPRVGAVAASSDEFGLIGTSLDGDGDSLHQRMRAATARIVRADSAGLEVVFEGSGRIAAIDGVGSTWFAVLAAINDTTPGSSYRLLRAIDKGRMWRDCGPIPAGSVTSVLAVSDTEAWVLGADTFGRTDDGGRHWQHVALEGERNPVEERLCRDRSGVALLAPAKLHASDNGGESWNVSPLPKTRLCDLSGNLLLGVWSGLPGIGERHATLPFAVLADDREPLRLAVTGTTLRVLTRAAKAERGPEMTIHRSEDRGATWSEHRVGLTPSVDIAGLQFGLGVDLIGAVHASISSASA
jgi:hypothetical protein